MEEVLQNRVPRRWMAQLAPNRGLNTNLMLREWTTYDGYIPCQSAVGLLCNRSLYEGVVLVLE